MNILLTSVTTDQIQAEVRVPGGHRLISTNVKLNNQDDYANWCSELYADSKLDIGTHFTCFPLKRAQIISRSDRKKFVEKWGSQLRFFHLPNQNNEVLAYAKYTSANNSDASEVTIFEVPFLSIFGQEWFGPMAPPRSESTALLYIGTQHSALSLFHANKLMNHAVIPFRTAEDLLYHFLFSLKQFSVSTDSCEVHLVGPRSDDETIVELFSEQIALKQELFETSDDSFQFDLKLLWKCAS